MQGRGAMQYDAVVDVLQRFYRDPASTAIRPLYPDRLGEYLVGEVFTTTLSLFAIALSTPSGDAASETMPSRSPGKAPLTVLTRLAQWRKSIGESLLKTVLGEHFYALIEDVVIVAQSTGDPVGSNAADELKKRSDTVIAGLIIDDLPVESLALRELAQVANALVLTETLPIEPTEQQRSERAHYLHNFGVRLRDVGRLEEALKASEKAVGIYRELALTAARPDAFRLDLAMSLNNLSSCLGALGRHEEALKAGEESVDVYRELALAAARPDAIWADLAVALNNLSSGFYALGRREEALKASEESVAIRRELAAARPDAFRSDLPGSLNNLSSFFFALGRHEQAFEASEESVAIRRKLTAARPDVNRPKLAGTLNNLSSFLNAPGRRKEALEAIEEAVAIYRELAAARPAAFQPNLAGSLTLLALVIAEPHSQKVIDAISEAMTIFEELCIRCPGVFEEKLEAARRVSHRLRDRNA